MPTSTFDAVPRRARRTSAATVVALIGFVALAQLAGATGAVLTDASWYRSLERPSWAPPGWVFGPVWIALYTMMGVAAWLIWRRRDAPARGEALTWFGVQLALNAAWTPIFFGLRSPGGGLAVIVALWLAIAATIACYRRCSRVAAWLMVPYLAWVTFATALNAAIVVRVSG